MSDNVLYSGRTEPTSECLLFCKEHSLGLYRDTHNVFYVVFDKIRDALPWSKYIIDMSFDGDDYLDFVVFATCKAVLRTMEGVVKIL